MFFRRFFVLALTLAMVARAQQPLNAPVPLLAAEPTTRSPGDAAKDLAAARSAQEVGLDGPAASLYESLLNTPGVDRSAVIIALASVYLDAGQGREAERVLQEEKGVRSAGWHLRVAMAAGQQKKVAQMRAEFDATKPEELPKSDESWHHFLQGMLTDMETPGGNKPKADVWYTRAKETAVNEYARVRFELAYEAERLRTIPASDDVVEATRRRMARFPGDPAGYDAARQLAVMEDARGNKARAVEVVQEQLRNLSPVDSERRDDFRLLIGVIDGPAAGIGRRALTELLEQGKVALKQRAALHLLARASQSGPARVQFRTLLDKLIEQTPSHPILDDLLLVRAQVALAAKTADGYAQADSDATRLQERFPRSPLIPYSHWVSAQAAWEQKRFLTAATSAAKARDALPVETARAARADLSVFVAEAWFRAGSLARAGGAGSTGGVTYFQNAAEAYAAALRDPPAGLVSELYFQRILSEIEAGALESAEKLVDSLAGVPEFDLRTRWKAEWNLARALQIEGRTPDAFARVSQLLATTNGATAAPLPPELRAQMAWLQARLSFDLAPSEETLALIDQLDRALAAVDRPELKMEIASTSLLLKAQTDFALRKTPAALETLEKLRKTYPRSSSTIQSYMVEANATDDSVKAQGLLTKLAEDFPDSEFAPQALFEAALQAESRGREENYLEAVRRIEQAIALQEKYPPKNPANDLVFTARMKQAQLLRQLNQLPQAQDVYQNLIHNYPQHGQISYAQLELAQCINSQAANDPAQLEKAESWFEKLTVSLEAPVDVRVEAGYNLGELFVRRGQPAKALEVWWRDVVHTFLDDSAMAAQLGATGRYWMTRTLLRTGEVLEQQGRINDARAAWMLIITAKLGGDAMAQQKLRPPPVVEGRQ